MRQISADCIFPVTSTPVINGILRLTDDAEVIDILKPGDKVTLAIEGLGLQEQIVVIESI